MTSFYPHMSVKEKQIVDNGRWVRANICSANKKIVESYVIIKMSGMIPDMKISDT